MIIELFGSSGAGKTTLARALFAALQNEGREVRLMSSSRPAEQCERLRSMRELRLDQLASPMLRASKAAGVLSALASRKDDSAIRELLPLLAYASYWTQLRYRRYLSMLGRSMVEAEHDPRIAIFDQGYMTALCSVASIAQLTGGTLLELALRLPAPDLLVFVDADLDTIEARIQDRLRRQGPLERAFEAPVDALIRQAEIADTLMKRLMSAGAIETIWVSGSVDPSTNAILIQRHISSVQVNECVSSPSAPRVSISHPVQQ